MFTTSKNSFTATSILGFDQISGQHNLAMLTYKTNHPNRLLTNIGLYATCLLFVLQYLPSISFHSALCPRRLSWWTTWTGLLCVLASIGFNQWVTPRGDQWEGVTWGQNVYFLRKLLWDPCVPGSRLTVLFKMGCSTCLYLIPGPGNPFLP